jgi:hypothetical protein
MRGADLDGAGGSGRASPAAFLVAATAAARSTAPL